MAISTTRRRGGALSAAAALAAAGAAGITSITGWGLAMPASAQTPLASGTPTSSSTASTASTASGDPTQVSGTSLCRPTAAAKAHGRMRLHVSVPRPTPKGQAGVHERVILHVPTFQGGALAIPAAERGGTRVCTLSVHRKPNGTATVKLIALKPGRVLFYTGLLHPEPHVAAPVAGARLDIVRKSS
jgi:hypothetical protein